MTAGKKGKTIAVLAIAGVCMFLAAGCKEQSLAQTSAVETVPVEQIIFNGVSISLKEYGALIEFYEQLSFEEVSIESNDDFIAAAQENELEHLYGLHEMISSLTPSEAGMLHAQALEALGDMQ